jgi:hypothetical protein
VRHGYRLAWLEPNGRHLVSSPDTSASGGGSSGPRESLLGVPSPGVPPPRRGIDKVRASTGWSWCCSHQCPSNPPGSLAFRCHGEGHIRATWGLFKTLSWGFACQVASPVSTFSASSPVTSTHRVTLARLASSAASRCIAGHLFSTMSPHRSARRLFMRSYILSM